METRRLEMLLELSRLGSMRNVADRLGTTTSTVSQQIAALSREVGTALVEPEGRRVRLTPAGRRLAGHAATILAAVDAARLALDPDAAPAGTVHVSAFATAIRRVLLPTVVGLAADHPDVKVVLHEHEPAEALGLLAADRFDLAVTYDYDLAPAPVDPALDTVPLWSAAWGLGVPAAAGVTAAASVDDTVAVFAAFRDHDWIGNSRNRADEDVVRVVASMAGFTPRLTHQSDDLDVVEDLIRHGLGVGLLPTDRRPVPGVTVLPLARPEVRLRAHAHTRPGRTAWPPLRLLLHRLSHPSATVTAGAEAP